MKAVQIEKYGGAPYIAELPIPIPTDEQVLVKVRAFAINPFDIKLAEGVMKEKIPMTFPYTPGGDFSGIIEATGEEVYGTATILGSGTGSFSQFLVVNRDKFAKKPSKLSFEEASGVVLAGISAHQALIDEIKLKKAQLILIHGGAGGIGHLAIQIAKHLGAKIATTVSSEDIDFVKGLGTDIVIDYKAQKFEKVLAGYNAVFDTVGGETLEKSKSVITPDGIIVSMVGGGVGVVTQNTKVTSESLARLTALIDGAQIKPFVNLFTFGDLQSAWEAQKSGPKGKIVVKA